MLASIGSAVAIQAAVMIDAIIVANFIGPDAMSAINVCTPVVAILVNVGYMVSMGATLLISKAIGENNMVRGSHIAAVSIVLLSVMGVVLAVAGYLLSDTLVSLICSNESIAGYAKVYLGLFFLLDLVPLFVYNAVCGFTEADGSPHVVTRSVIIGGVVNFLLDLLFVGVFHWGISGAMYATVINDLVVIAILCHHLYRNSTLRYHLPPTGFVKMAREIFSEGVPLTVGEVALMVGLMALNFVIITTLGSGGMYIWSVCMEIFTLVLIAMSGVETSMVSIGGFLTGDEDVTGLRLLVHHALKVVGMLLLVLTLFILIGIPAVGTSFCQRSTFHQSDAIYGPYHWCHRLFHSHDGVVGFPRLQCAHDGDDVCLYAVLPLPRPGFVALYACSKAFSCYVDRLLCALSDRSSWRVVGTHPPFCGRLSTASRSYQ